MTKLTKEIEKEVELFFHSTNRPETATATVILKQMLCRIANKAYEQSKQEVLEEVRGCDCKKLFARFWKKVKVTDSCWNWTGAITGNGYGHFGRKYETIAAHRFSHEFFKGKIPPKHFVIHSCDNRKCVNPAHLSVGTPMDNVRDMISKNRQNYVNGEQVGTSKLKKVDVMNIRKLVETGEKTAKELAAEYGVHPSAISLIVTNKSWKHVLECSTHLTK